MDQILKAGERATRITRQLLAFSRNPPLQKSVLSLRRVIDLFIAAGVSQSLFQGTLNWQMAVPSEGEYNPVTNPPIGTIPMTIYVFSQRSIASLVHGGGFVPYQAGRWVHGWHVRPEPKVHVKESPGPWIEHFYLAHGIGTDSRQAEERLREAGVDDGQPQFDPDDAQPAEDALKDDGAE